MENLLYRIEGGRVKCYHTLNLIGQQTVAEQTFRAVQILRFINDVEESAAYTRLLQGAMDYLSPKVVLGDVPASLRTETPIMGEVLSSLERSLGDTYDSAYESLEDKGKDLVELAFVLEQAHFGIEQAQLGAMNVGLKLYSSAVAQLKDFELTEGAQEFVDCLSQCLPQPPDEPES